MEILHLLLWVPLDHCLLPNLIHVTGMSAGPLVLGSAQHLAPLPHPLRTVTGQHLFIDAGPIPSQTAARNRFSHLHGVNTSVCLLTNGPHISTVCLNVCSLRLFFKGVI